MRRILFITLLLPVLLPAQPANTFHAPLLFEENAGQVNMQAGNTGRTANPQLLFVLKGKALSYYFSERGYSVVQRTENGMENRTDFFFANGKTVLPEAVNEAPTNFSCILPQGNLHVKEFEKIIYHNAFENADLEFSVRGNALVKKIIMHPGFEGTVQMEVNGSLALSGTEGNFDFVAGDFKFAETVFRVDDGVLVAALHDSHFARQSLPYTYSISRFDNSQQTQSSSISWITYLGGNNSDELFGIALTNDNGVVVAGRTSSMNFPTTPGSMQDSISLSYDAVIARFDSAGTCLWSTLYGGSNFDGAYGVIADDSVFVITGASNSTDLVMGSAPQDSLAGGYDAFLLVLDNAGQLVNASYYGGSGSDQGFCIAKGTNGEIVIAGSSTSLNLPFTSGGFQPAMGGMSDAFLARFDPNLNVLWSTYYGGNNVEDIHAITVSPQNEIAFVGGTRSFNFPVSANAWQSGLLNQPDNYLVKFNMNGTRLYSTFFGGTNNEDANGIEADGAGNLYMTGFTYSADFPTQGTTFQTNIQGQDDLYVSRFDSTGQLVWSTFVGGSGQDIPWGIYQRGKYIYVCGQTDSPNFPVSANAIQPAIGLNGDGFVIKMDTTGQMVSGTFMGGNGVDALLALTVDADTNVYACGDTYSTNLPNTSGAYQPVNGTNGDGFLVKFGMSEELVSTAVNNISPANAILLYPNPSSDFVTLSSTQNISRVELRDAAGRLLLDENANAQNVQLDLRTLSKGIYFVKVWENNELHVLKLVRE